MKKITMPVAAAVLSLSSAVALSQTPPATPATSDPSAASSPHQRDVTKRPGDEATPSGGSSPSDAATPHQKDAMKKHKKKPKPADSTTQQ